MDKESYRMIGSKHSSLRVVISFGEWLPIAIHRNYCNSKCIPVSGSPEVSTHNSLVMDVQESFMK